MLVVLLALGSAGATAVGIYLTKGLTRRLPVWQSVGPLFLLNAALVAPFAVGAEWKLGRPDILLLHLMSAAALIISTACVFRLVTRGRASAVATAQAVSPAAALAAAPLLLGSSPHAWTLPAVLLVVAGALLPIQHAFEGMSAASALVLMALAGASAGVLTVLTAVLVREGVGVPETYAVRTTLAGLVYVLVSPPRTIPASALPALGTRSMFITTGFVLTIIAVERGNPVLVQSILGTTPLLVAMIELLRLGSKPPARVLIGAAVAGLGVTTMASLG